MSVVDLNFGCPVRDVAEKSKAAPTCCATRRGWGKSSNAWRPPAPTPVTAKIRLGCTRDSILASDIAQAVEDAGGAALTVHGRTAADLFRGRADWEQIARIKPHLRRIPLIGNGDLMTPQGVVEAIGRYGVDGVMIGRAGLNRPWLFRQAAAALAGEPIPPDPSPPEQKQLLMDHYRGVVEQFGPLKGTILMRKFACCYAQGWPGARAFRGEVAVVATPEEFCRVVERYFPQ